MDITKLDGHINTYSGRKLSLFNPNPDMIDIHDISLGLSNKGHFAGQTPYYFSIAEHSTLVVDLMREEYKLNSSTKNLFLAAILHDASEAYIGDMVKPLKVHIPKFKEVEDNLTKVIFERYNVPLKYLKIMKRHDIDAQKIEASCFYGGNVNARRDKLLRFYSPYEANTNFQNYFFTIFNIK